MQIKHLTTQFYELKSILQVQKAELEANLIYITSFMTPRANRDAVSKKEKKNEKKIILQGSGLTTIDIEGSAGKYCISLSPERTSS